VIRSHTEAPAGIPAAAAAPASGAAQRFSAGPSRLASGAVMTGVQGKASSRPAGSAAAEALPVAAPGGGRMREAMVQMPWRAVAVRPGGGACGRAGAGWGVRGTAVCVGGAPWGVTGRGAIEPYGWHCLQARPVHCASLVAGAAAAAGALRHASGRPQALRHASWCRAGPAAFDRDAAAAGPCGGIDAGEARAHLI
jgi:hypothetical protein